MIAVCLITYNHEQYIAQAINSILVQETSVPVKIFIGEDCSTDQTRDICINYKEKYPETIDLELNDSNQGLVKNTMNLLKKIQKKGYKYIAILDGDDYWIDKNKLQKQYDMLEKTDKIGLVHTNNEVLWNNGRIEKISKSDALSGYVFDHIEKFNVANCTVMFQTSLLQYINFDEFLKQGFMSCDYVMYAIFSKYSKFGFLEDFTAVWRRGHSTVSNTNNIIKDIAYIENDIRMWNYLGDLFPDRFGHTEKDSEAWRNFRIFNIAFRYKDYELANNILQKGNMQGRNSFSFKIKKLAATNRLLFYLWGFLKR